MPLVRMATSHHLDEKQRTVLMRAFSKQVSEILGKPESYTMVIVADRISMLMGGSDAPSAFVEIRSVGMITPAQSHTLSELLSKTVSSTIAVTSERIYLNCVSCDGAMWGWNGDTFA